MTASCAPGITPGDKVVLFDGVCKLCNATVKFLLRFDTRRRFKLCACQSPAGQAILRHLGLPTDTFESFVLVEGSRAYFKSTAVVRILVRLPFPWPLAAISWLVPWFIRDWVYDRIAKNRYRIFGKYDACLLPSPEHAGRFLR